MTLAHALAGEGYVEFRHSHLAQAQAKWESALTRAESAGEDRVAAGILRSLAIAAASGGRQDQTGELIDRAITLARSTGDDQQLRLLLGSAAERNLWLGDYQGAEDAYGDALALASAIGDLSARPLLLAELGWVGCCGAMSSPPNNWPSRQPTSPEVWGTAACWPRPFGCRARPSCGGGGRAPPPCSTGRSGWRRSWGRRQRWQGCAARRPVWRLKRSDGGGAKLGPDGGRAVGVATSDAAGLPSVGTGHGCPEGGRPHLGRKAIPGRPRGDEAGKVVRHQANSYWGLAGVSAASGHVSRAVGLHQRALLLRHHMGDRLGVVDSLIGLATVMAPVEPDARPGSSALRWICGRQRVRGRPGARPPR